eukprot:gnl/TRDRNA2_/TRDRNA2_172723_c1_seq1.p1 gnl/TRDRNA2_/TRDRNA2_172723_c1~~gnl/TRDRNA2_/TRDRNA2_172723_c1_seq1.p1  ORF type:complete len:1016 (+),score=262.65 gnl/TRDRNA2_/TRDRNA2_172723_c1_seq1:94-3141(+)
MASVIGEIVDVVAPMWVEMSFMMTFALGFVILKFFTSSFPRVQNKQKIVDESHAALKKDMEADLSTGQAAKAAAAWRAAKTAGDAPSGDVLRLAVQALIKVDPTNLVTEIVAHMSEHRKALCVQKTAAAVLDIVAREGTVEQLEQFYAALKDELWIAPTSQMNEVLLGGFAAAGKEQKVAEFCAEMHASRQKITARGFSLIIKGFLKSDKLDAALRHVREMSARGFFVPSYAYTNMFRSACEANRAAEVFDGIKESIALPADSLGVLLDDCLKRGDRDLARRIDKRAVESQVPLLFGSYEALMKLYIDSCDPRAMELFQEMPTANMKITDGLCVGLLARCAEPKFLRFAEEIVRYVRAESKMTISAYSALMKVYAHSGMYTKACDLYKDIRAEGLEPDAMMYGCLMKFSVECGRTELSRELFDKTPSVDIQNYMSLIRAAGRDRDADRAFAVLQRLKGSGVQPDIPAYNCVLDVCVVVGELQRARGLLQEMRTVGSLDVVTYNTLLKGHCMKGDLRGAKSVLSEMEAENIAPNDVSYNCLVNAAVSAGNLQEAWDTISRMEKSGVPVDHYTLSIMMKALKKVRSPKDVGRALALLDRASVNICGDEVLLNTVLEVCIRHREHRRLDSIISVFEKSSLRPSVPTYGSLIKAAGTLQRERVCWEFWRQMTEQRILEPNEIVLGCMLDALVCCSRTEEAVKLFDQWKRKVTPNAVMYSTLIKGFANCRRADRAMDLWHDMQEAGVQPNIVAFNSLIDSQARVGNMDAVSKLFSSMESHGCCPDVITYSTIIKGYCVNGDLEKAFEVFTSMKENSMVADSIIYNTVLDGCIRHNRMDLADSILEDMERRQVPPSNFTLGIIVKMWGRRRQLEKAMEAVETLPKKHGFVANAQVYTCLMCTCLNNNAVDRAIQVFRELQVSGQPADAKAYGALISGCVRHGRIEYAVALVEEAQGLNGKRGLPEGQALESDPLEQLMRALAQRGLTEQVAAPLLERLRAAKCPIGSRLLASSLPQGYDRR